MFSPGFNIIFYPSFPIRFFSTFLTIMSCLRLGIRFRIRSYFIYKFNFSLSLFPVDIFPDGVSSCSFVLKISFNLFNTSLSFVLNFFAPSFVIPLSIPSTFTMVSVTRAASFSLSTLDKTFLILMFLTYTANLRKDSSLVLFLSHSWCILLM